MSANFDFSKQYETKEKATKALVVDLNTARVNQCEILIREIGDPEDLAVYKYRDSWVIRHG